MNSPPTPSPFLGPKHRESGARTGSAPPHRGPFPLLAANRTGEDRIDDPAARTGFFGNDLWMTGTLIPILTFAQDRLIHNSPSARARWNVSHKNHLFIRINSARWSHFITMISSQNIVNRYTKKQRTEALDRDS